MVTEEVVIDVTEGVVIDKDVDGAVLRIVQDAELDTSPSLQSASGRKLVFESVLTKQQPNFANLVDEMPSQSVLRRLLKLLFPLVDESQRVRS